MAQKSTSKLFQNEETKELQENDMNLPVDENGEVDMAKIIESQKEKIEKSFTETEEPEDDIVDIDLSVIKRKKFRINQDNSKILELNVSDMGIASRLKEAYPRLNQLMDDVADKLSGVDTESDEVTEEDIIAIGDAIDIIDKRMREELDYIFDAPVSEICGSDGSMWDPIEGSFRYEHIIDKLVGLYENNLDKEFRKMKRRVENKAGKYVNLQDHKQEVKR